jgi:hypothetical protein
MLSQDKCVVKQFNVDVGCRNSFGPAHAKHCQVVILRHPGTVPPSPQATVLDRRVPIIKVIQTEQNSFWQNTWRRRAINNPRESFGKWKGSRWYYEVRKLRKSVLLLNSKTTSLFSFQNLNSHAHARVSQKHAKGVQCYWTLKTEQWT